MVENFDAAEIWGKISSWLGDFFWNNDTIYQGIIIIVSFIIGTIIYRATRSRLIDAIEKLKIPWAARRIANNLRKLVMPLSTLIIMFLATMVAGSDLFMMDVTLSEGMMKLLVAWIIIRTALQFIDNRAIRNFFALSIWAVAALSIFGVLDETTTALDSIGMNVGEFRLSALVIIKGILSIFTLLYIAIFTSTFVERRVYKINGLTRSSQVLITKIIRITLIVFALLIGITSAGIDLSLFAVFSGAIGLGIGFGLQKVVSNLFSGFLLLMDQSIKPGDVLELESGTFGWVQHMGARYTEIVTRDNKSFLVPNEDFITQRVVNWSHGNTLIRLEVKFGVHYKHNPREVKEIVEKISLDSIRVCSDPAPVCHLAEFGDSSLNFKFRFWIKDAEKGITNIRGEVMLALWDAFKEQGIEFTYPYRELIITERKTA